MEDILGLYEEAYDPRYPFKEDDEYERKGTCSIFIVCEPHTGWRYLEVGKQRPKVDYAEFMDRVSVMYQEMHPEVEKIRVVQDNLNTHTYGSFYENFNPEKARRLKNLFEFHYTPKKASWLNMAEIEISALARQCLDRRIGDMEILEREAKAWEKDRNEQKIMIQWRFTTNHAREKLERHYNAVRN